MPLPSPVVKGLPMKSGDVPNLHLLQHLRVLNPPVLFLLSTSCAFNWDACLHSNITKQEYLSRSNEYLPSNHVNHLISVCLYTYSNVTAQCAWLGIHAKSRTSHGENGKASWEDLGCAAAWEAQRAVTPGRGQQGLPGSRFPLWRGYVGVCWLCLVN